MHTVTSEILAIKAVFTASFTSIASDKFIRLARKSKAVAEFIFAVAFSAHTCALCVTPNVVRVWASFVHNVFLAAAILETESNGTLTIKLVRSNSVFSASFTLSSAVHTTVAELTAALALSVSIVEVEFPAVNRFTGAILFFRTIGADTLIVLVNERILTSVTESISVVTGSATVGAASAGSVGHHVLAIFAGAFWRVALNAATVFCGHKAIVTLFAHA